MKNKILVSDKFDQKYNHTILVKNNTGISLDEMNALLSKMEKAGELSALWEKNGLE